MYFMMLPEKYNTAPLQVNKIILRTRFAKNPSVKYTNFTVPFLIFAKLSASIQAATMYNTAIPEKI